MKKINKTFYIGQMTCVNCQNRIKRALKQEPGVLSAIVDYKNGTAEVAFNQEQTDFTRIKSVIEALGYTVSEHSDLAYSDLLIIIGQLAVILSLFFILDRFGILTLLVPDRLADSAMSFGMLFVIGLITSIHCIAMCGGINLSVSLPRKGDSEKTGRAAFTPTLLYNAGRVVSYTVIGFILGGIGFLIGGGSGPGLPVVLQGLLKMAAGIFMVIMGVNMLGLFPLLKKVTLPRTGKIGGHLYRFIRGRSSTFLIGILNGFMPCGPLESMWIVALASANPLTGALSMFLFSLGTVPLMLGLGSVVSLLGKKFARMVTKVGAVLVVVLGLAMLSQGGALSGMLTSEQILIIAAGLALIGIVTSIPFSKRSSRKLGTAAAAGAAIFALIVAFHPAVGQAVAGETDPASDGVQYISSTLSPGTYPTITVEQGIPVYWTIMAPEGSLNGCNYRMILEGVEYSLQEGENVIEFTPEETGTIPYTCWMGMIRGSINVLAPSGESSDESYGSREDRVLTEDTMTQDSCCTVPDSLSPGCCGD